jgi:hypothetical protein
VAKREWLTGTDQPNGVRPVWVPHLRRANRPPQVEEFVCGCVFFWSTSLWVSGPLFVLAWIASSCGVRFLSKPEGQLASASSAPLGSISNRVGGKFGKSSLGTIFTAGKLEPQFECVLLSMKVIHSLLPPSDLGACPLLPAWPKSRIVRFPHKSPFPGPAAGLRPPLAGDFRRLWLRSLRLWILTLSN